MKKTRRPAPKKFNPSPKEAKGLLEEIGAKIIEEWQRQEANKVNPAKLEWVVSMDEDFPREFNTLFADPARRLFLANTKGGKIKRGKDLIPLSESRPFEFKEVSLVEALSWYARCNPFSNGGDGSLELLCEMAAKELSGKGGAR